MTQTRAPPREIEISIEFKILQYARNNEGV